MSVTIAIVLLLVHTRDSDFESFIERLEHVVWVNIFSSLTQPRPHGLHISDIFYYVRRLNYSLISYLGQVSYHKELNLKHSISRNTILQQKKKKKNWKKSGIIKIIAVLTAVWTMFLLRDVKESRLVWTKL